MTTRGRRAVEFLRGYTFDPRTHRYRNLSTGRIVSRANVLAKLDTSLAQRQARITGHVDDLISGRMSGNLYLSLEKRLVKQQALQQAALAAGGWDRLTPSDRGRVGQMLRQVYKAQADLVKGIAEGTISPAQAAQRVHMAMGAVRTVGLQVDLAHQPPAKQGMVRIEIRDAVMDKGTCPECEQYHNMGYQLEGELPRPGEACSCRGSCRCALHSREIPEAELSNYLGHR